MITSKFPTIGRSVIRLTNRSAQKPQTFIRLFGTELKPNPSKLSTGKLIIFSVGVGAIGK